MIRESIWEESYININVKIWFWEVIKCIKWDLVKLNKNGVGCIINRLDKL